MKRMYLSLCYLVLINSFFFLKCQNKGSTQKFEEETKVFKNYLKENINSDINKRHLYIIIPTIGCQACIKKSIVEIQNYNNKICNYSIITSNEDYLKLFNKKNFILDSEFNLDYLNFPINNLTLVETDEFKISNIFTTNLDNTDSIKFYLKKYFCHKN